MKFTMMVDWEEKTKNGFVIGLDVSCYYESEGSYWDRRILDFTINDLEELALQRIL
jgi:hypothetical protein